MRICIICNEYPPGPHGGIGTMNQMLVQEFVKAGHEVYVVGLYDKTYPAQDHEQSPGVEVFRLKRNMRGKLNVMLHWREMFHFVRRLEKSYGFDVVEIPDSYGWFSVWGRLQAPVIVRCHGANTYFSRILNAPLKRSTRFLENHLMHKARAVCAVSRYTAAVISEVFNYGRHIEVIHNGIDISYSRSFSRMEKSSLAVPPTVIYSGTLIRKKGVLSLIKAAVGLFRKGVYFDLIINGKDSVDELEQVSTKELMVRLIPDEYEARVVFNGHVTREEILKQYQAGSVAVFPSYAEAFAMAPLEAMAVGIPVIYSKAGSGPELIEDYIDGILIDPDSPLEIEEAIEYLLRDAARAEVIGNNGRKKVQEHFSKEKMAAETIGYYKKHLLKYEN